MPGKKQTVQKEGQTAAEREEKSAPFSKSQTEPVCTLLYTASNNCLCSLFREKGA